MRNPTISDVERMVRITLAYWELDNKKNRYAKTADLITMLHAIESSKDIAMTHFVTKKDQQRACEEVLRGISVAYVLLMRFWDMEPYTQENHTRGDVSAKTT